MKQFIYIIFFLNFCIACGNLKQVSYPFKNDHSIVSLHEYYNGYGKVFKNFNEADNDENYPLPSDYFKDLLLTEQLLIRIENIWMEDVNNYYSTIPGEKIIIKNPKKYFKHYYRQYVGYVNLNGDSIVVVNLLNFKNKLKAKKYFDDWKYYFNDGMGGFYEKNRTSFVLNLNKNCIIKW